MRWKAPSRTGSLSGVLAKRSRTGSPPGRIGWMGGGRKRGSESRSRAIRTTSWFAVAWAMGPGSLASPTAWFAAAGFSDLSDVRYTGHFPRRRDLMACFCRLLLIVALLPIATGAVPAASAADGDEVDTVQELEAEKVAPAPEIPLEERYTTPEEQFWVGFNYLYGRGVEKDPVEAYVWFRKAAERGNSRAQVHLGMSYSKGRGVARDPAEAVRWLELAAEQNHSKAQLEVGIAYFRGAGVRRDRIRGLMWMVLAVETGGLVARVTVPDYLKNTTTEERRRAGVLVREWRIAHGLPVPADLNLEGADPDS
ncbi:MAG: hypothetical protein CL938_16545 [Deltaproteobacteria bacterium]|nr:hypothetical protein [Deltaproteobacteria bacterium]